MGRLVVWGIKLLLVATAYGSHGFKSRLGTLQVTPVGNAGRREFWSYPVSSSLRPHSSMAEAQRSRSFRGQHQTPRARALICFSIDIEL